MPTTSERLDNCAEYVRERVREVYVAVSVTITDGKATGAEVDCEGAPWSHCKPETFDHDSETWSEASEEDERAALDYLRALKVREGARPYAAPLRVRVIPLAEWTGSGVGLGPFGPASRWHVECADTGRLLHQSGRGYATRGAAECAAMSWRYEVVASARAWRPA